MRMENQPRWYKLATMVMMTFFMLLVMFYPLTGRVSASPGVISEPSFETVTGWTYSETDADYTGAQSTTWKTQGTYSYLLSTDGTGNIPSDKYSQVLQSVNFDTLDTISFDADLYAATDGLYEARVIIGTTTIWSQACNTTETEYLHQEIDVSTYNGSQDLIFQVITIAAAKDVAMNVYYDNIKTWGSFNDSAHTTVNNDFDTTAEYTVYMYGENFGDSISYHICYYDGDGTLLLSEAQTSNVTGELSGQCYFPTYEDTAAAGLWHVVVYEDPISPPSTYTSDDPNRTVEDSFNVTVAAIPEFPTVIAAIAVACTCFGIYYWMRKRKRRLAHVKV